MLSIEIRGIRSSLYAFPQPEQAPPPLRHPGVGVCLRRLLSLLGPDCQIQARDKSRRRFLTLLHQPLALLNLPAPGSGDPAGAARNYVPRSTPSPRRGLCSLSPVLQRRAPRASAGHLRLEQVDVITFSLSRQPKAHHRNNTVPRQPLSRLGPECQIQARDKSRRRFLTLLHQPLAY